MSPTAGRQQGASVRRGETLHLRSQLSDATLRNAHYVTLLSKILHLTTTITATDHSPELHQIKLLIENSGALEFNAATENKFPNRSSHVPPLHMASQDIASSPPITSTDMSDVLYLSDNNLSEFGGKSSSSSSSGGGGGSGGNEDKDEDKDEDDVEDDADDHVEDEEFSLEEELEGIADAPVKERAAMRMALRKKQLALNRQMRDSAADKRRIAEQEALHIRKTLLGDEAAATPRSHPAGGQPHQPAQAPPSSYCSRPKAMPMHKHAGGHAHDSAKGAFTESAQSTHSPQSTRSTHTANTAEPAEPAPNAPNAEPSIAETLVFIDDNDESDTNQSSSIISFDATTPKNSSRFGITFDPSKLDEATTDCISGVAGNKDTRRSVLVQNIPPETTMHELLAYIRGGPIVAAKLVTDPTDGGGSQMAMVTFRTSMEAHTCIAQSASFVSRFDLASKLRVGLIPTASYPSSDVIPDAGAGYLGLSTAEQPTRCLSVDNFPKYLINELCTELYLNMSRLPDKLHVLEEMWFAQDTLFLHFTSIQEAKKAHGTLTFLHYGRYRNDVHYAPDPCSSTSFDVSSTGAVKLASHGHQGLKSLLQTVGLVTYARNQEKLYMQKMSGTPAAAAASRSGPVTATAPPAVASSLSQTSPSQSRPPKTSVPSMTSDTASLLMSINSGMCGTETAQDQGSEAHCFEGCAKVSPAVDSSPWTDTLMVGLDMLS